MVGARREGGREGRKGHINVVSGAIGFFCLVCSALLSLWEGWWVGRQVGILVFFGRWRLCALNGNGLLAYG